MEQVVGYETAKELQSAGFPQGDGKCDECGELCCDCGPVRKPNALEIIEQMPPMTSISKNYFGVWECSFVIGQYQTDYRADPCPHKAAALAFIAWKKGQE